MAIIVNPGRLRHLITLQRLTDTPDGVGGFTREWATYLTTYAEVLSQAGRESLVAGTIQGVTPYRITMRYQTDIRTADRILFGDLQLNVRSITDLDGRRRWSEIFADTESPQ
jgi:SPP1 family predicted phage head-tail adaptor